MGLALLPFTYTAAGSSADTSDVSCEGNYSISVGVFLLALGASEFAVYLVCKLMAWYANDAFYSQSLDWIHVDCCVQEEDTKQELISQYLEKCEYDPSELTESCCPICLVDYDRGELVSHGRCHHSFHESCLVQWLAKHSSCPCCRECIIAKSAPPQKGEGDTRNVVYQGLSFFPNWFAYPDAAASDPSLFLFMV